MRRIPIGVIQGMLALLLISTTPLACALALCDGVIAFQPGPNLNVRASASTSASIIGSVPYNGRGRIMEGPIDANGYTWWRVYWMENVTGWTAGRVISTNELYYTNLEVPDLVYGDDILPGWCLQPWTGAAVTPQSNIQRVGSYGIRTETTTQWARLYLKTNGKSLSGINSLRFSIRSESADGNNLWVALQKADGTAYAVYKPIAEYVSGGTLVESSWYDVRIPIADLGVSQSNTVYGVVIQSLSPSVFFADDIALDTVSGTTKWTGGTTVTGVTVSCAPGTVAVNQATQCTANVSGTGTYNHSVTWSVSTGSINANGLYAAPQSPTTATITATSVGDPTKSGSTTVSVVQASQAWRVVYHDAIDWGWDVGEWPGATVTLNAPNFYRGTSGITMQTSGNWQRMRLMTASGFKFNTTGYESLSLALNVGALVPNNPISIALLRQNGTEIQYVNASEYAQNGTIGSYQWKHIRIPLADLGATSTDVYGVDIQSDKATTLYVDEVQFETTGTNGGCQ